jgi:hypothetical protein
MIRNNKTRNYKGFLKIIATKEIYQICEVSMTKKEIILSLNTSSVTHVDKC